MENKNNDYYYDKTDEQSGGGYNYGEPEKINVGDMMTNGRKSRAWSVASFVCAIVSIICCCIPVAGLVFGGGAILFAVISRINLGYFDGFSIAGLIVAIFGVVFCVSAILFTGSEYYKQFVEEFSKSFEEEYNNAAGGNTPDF